MTPNNNFSILPFYGFIKYQNHRKNYSFGEIYPLMFPDSDLPNFQAITSDTMSLLASDYDVILRDLDGVNRGDFAQSFQNYGSITSHSNYNVIRYPGTASGANITSGQYYIELYDISTDQSVVSEVFTVTSSLNLSSCLRIEFYDDEDLIFEGGRIEYQDGFKWTLYLPTEIGRPEYPFTEDVQERDGYSFIEKQVSEKTFKFNFTAPEFLLDAMRVIRMSDHITIEDKEGRDYDVQTFLMTPEWLDGGYLASVEVEFQCDTIVKKIGKTV